MTVIDIHSHMFGHDWLRMLKSHGAPDYGSEKLGDGRTYLMEKGAAACAFEEEAFDYEKRIRMMDYAGIDLAIVSLTSPNVQWGGEDISSKTARLANQEMAEGEKRYPDRIRWFASLPWEYPDKALKEINISISEGAVGIFVAAHLGSKDLIDPIFEPIWNALNDLSVPILVHPTTPYGAREANFGKERILIPGVGFMYDTTFAITRMIMDGFFDRYQKLKIIVSHGGGYLPFIAGRLDIFAKAETLADISIKNTPSEYLENIFYDSIVYDKGALDLVFDISSSEHIMFGTDQPMPHDVDKLKEIIKSRTQQEQKRVLSKNAEKVFRL